MRESEIKEREIRESDIEEQRAIKLLSTIKSVHLKIPKEK